MRRRRGRRGGRRRARDGRPEAVLARLLEEGLRDWDRVGRRGRRLRRRNLLDGCGIWSLSAGRLRKDLAQAARGAPSGLKVAVEVAVAALAEARRGRLGGEARGLRRWRDGRLRRAPAGRRDGSVRGQRKVSLDSAERRCRVRDGRRRGRIAERLPGGTRVVAFAVLLPATETANPRPLALAGLLCAVGLVLEVGRASTRPEELEVSHQRQVALSVVEAFLLPRRRPIASNLGPEGRQPRPPFGRARVEVVEVVAEGSGRAGAGLRVWRGRQSRLVVRWGC